MANPPSADRPPWPGPRCFAASRRSLAFGHATGMANPPSADRPLTPLTRIANLALRLGAIRPLPGGERRALSARLSRCFLGGNDRRLGAEVQPVGAVGDLDHRAVADLAEQDLFRQRVLQLLLDHPLQRARAIGRIVALARPASRAPPRRARARSCDPRAALRSRLSWISTIRAHVLAAQPVEQDDLVDPVEEFRPERRAHHAHHIVAHRIDILVVAERRRDIPSRGWRS